MPDSNIPVVTDDIEEAFLDGVNEVYDVFFTKKIPFYFLDTNNSVINSYGETYERVYKEPIYLTARVVIEPKNGDKTINRDYNIARIRVPTQNLWDNGISVDSKTLALMRKGKFVWNGIGYQVERIRPKSMINDTFIVHEFICEEMIFETDYREVDE